MIRLAIFILFSVLLLVFTLRRTHEHRFPRFFAFVSFIGLVLLNVDSWFRDPLSPVQLVSWILLASSLVLVVHGFWLLQVAGSPKGDIEETTRLVTMGAYRYIRHPIYCSLLPGGAGVLLKDPSPVAVALFLASFVFIVAT
ncbi:MAG: isoprenylcysteine carboxylmethyltransferase family protein, partial [Gemmatimonadales bacterium]|nr:isoprenylcysteine carboxylmethyltransferase family protein [Gemmatimonadales bacterium]